MLVEPLNEIEVVLAVGILGVVSADEAVDSAFDAARGVAGGGWEVQVEVHGLLVGFGL